MGCKHIFGWYERPDQRSDEPSYDPPHDVPCLFCGENITPSDVRTLSMLALEGEFADKSYFYRVHRTCHEAADEPERRRIDDLIWQSIRGSVA